MTDRTSSAMDTGDDAKTKIKAIWSRLRAVPAPIVPAMEDCQGESIVPSLPDPAQSEVANGPGAFLRLVERDDAAPSAVILPFPVRGEALLVKLADQLRSRFADGELERDLLLLTMSRCPESRLSIDHDAYVEFHADESVYHVAIETVPDTRIMLDTTDFDTVVNFVAHYLAGRLPASAGLEALS
jgi:hypothetical protein